jgi:hypothetical protein
MKAIHWNKNIIGLIELREGESNFKTINEFYTDFKVNGKNVGPIMKPCIVLDTPNNRELLAAIQKEHKELKDIQDLVEKNVYKYLNKMEKP